MEASNVSNSSESNLLAMKDPLYIRKIVKQFVEIKTIAGTSICGTIYTVDPISGSVILLNRVDDRISMDIVMGHSISSISPATPPPGLINENIPDDVFLSDDKISFEESSHRKIALKSWLCENRFPVVEDGNLLVIEDILVIHPPYGPDQCLSCNDTVLERVTDLMRRMPFPCSEKD